VGGRVPGLDWPRLEDTVTSKSARRLGVVMLCLLGTIVLFVYVAWKPAYDRARADYQKVMASDGGAYINGHLTLPR
jgi:hypothetical protein